MKLNTFLLLGLLLSLVLLVSSNALETPKDENKEAVMVALVAIEAVMAALEAAEAVMAALEAVTAAPVTEAAVMEAGEFPEVVKPTLDQLCRYKCTPCM
ncbi:hypothetical protein DCAR_0522561 [Daucus carota subsp. sativus]|uniref:Uncharacterized protein n=1 Tax=Daucus carota subsp. sativus TaxID=79200 RepID=A0A164ZVS1_DAUCS|nr:hypothetical protein DCAR_0522561 [Daucus carota subsp. sativus]